ncbi:MAG TPA: hypothetical protein PL065_09745, partial [Polyangiaceae bacterium]|nr:hypothetical protein [Polyangiaceae bacterium]
MALVLKQKKKLQTRAVGSGGPRGGGETSALRPKHVLKTPPCTDGCPIHTAIPGALQIMAQTEDYGRTRE